ncbi:hypothetical protein BaRGS_00005955 [Batillaria attramentaria]|uniref:Denticleless n=1 Tax=Batillaria attramentaria TaxID=370345 RepID=A0ABD0LT41_9CAEN
MASKLTNGLLPELSKRVFVERFENSDADCHKLFFDNDSDEIGVPMTCKFGRDNFSHVCGVADELGGVRLYDTTKDARRPLLHYWTAHSNAVFDVAWVHGENKVLTASGDQSAALWDVNRSVPITTFKGHTCSVRSVAPCPDSPAGKYHAPVKAIHNAHSLVRRADVNKHRRKTRRTGPVLDTQQSVTCVLYQSDNLLISAGAVDGCVKVWDTRKTYIASAASLPVPLYCFEYPGIDRRRKGLISMAIDHTCSRLFASYTDNTIYCFDIVRYHKDPVSPDGKYLISGSSNTTAFIWQVDKPEEWPVALYGHEEDVSAVDWCPSEITKLATVADDATLRIWRPSEREEGTPLFVYSSSCGFAKDQAPRKRISGDKPKASQEIEPLHTHRSPAKTAQLLVAAARKPSTGQAQGTKPCAAHDSGAGTSQEESSTSRSAIPVSSQNHQQSLSDSLEVAPLDSSRACCEEHVPEEANTPGKLPIGWTWPVPSSAIPEDKEETEERTAVVEGNRDRENAENVFRISAKEHCQKPDSNSSTLEKVCTSPGSPSKHRLSPRSLFQENSSDDNEIKAQLCEMSPTKRQCLKDIDTNSPSKRDIMPVSSAREFTSRTNGGLPKPLFFSSPTMNLPNSVLDTPQDKRPPKVSSPQTEGSHKPKRDWLTDYRLSHPTTPDSSKAGKKVGREASPAPTTPKDKAASPCVKSLSMEDRITPSKKKASVKQCRSPPTSHNPETGENGWL